MTRTKLTFIAVLLLAPACAIDDDASGTTPVFDACTHEVVGFKDLARGELIFDDGTFYMASMISNAELSKDLCKNPGVAKKEDMMPTTMSFAPMRCFQYADPTCGTCCDGKQCFESCSSY